LATAIVALDVLGPEHRYRTELLAVGEIKDGVLSGDLVLKGGGDPTLELADLLELLVRLETKGVRQVEGRFLVDDTVLPSFSEIAPRQPPEAAYNPSIGALSLASHRVHFTSWGGGDLASPATPDEPRVELAPPSLLPSSGVELRSALDQGLVWRVADAGLGRPGMALSETGSRVGHMFRWLALVQGIELGWPQRASAPTNAYVLAVHESAPLHQLLRHTLVQSDNRMAELIGLSAARRLDSGVSSLGAAGALLLRHLRHLMPSVDWRGAVLGNHSGLDGGARMTPRQLAAILRYGWHHHALAALLASGGWSGTLSNRFRGSATALRVWAKTGTLHYGGALAGYLFTENRRPTAFVTMVSDLAERAKYDLLPGPDPTSEEAARVWNAGARALQDDLVESWLQARAASRASGPVLPQVDRARPVWEPLHQKRPSLKPGRTGSNDPIHIILPSPFKPKTPVAKVGSAQPAGALAAGTRTQVGPGLRDGYAVAREHMRSGEPAAAEQELRHFLASNPGHARAYYDLGYLLLQQGRYAEAADKFRMSLQIAPGGGAHVLYGLGAALSSLRKYDEAVNYFARAAELDPHNPFVYYDWGWALEHLDLLEEAQEKYELAVAAGPDSRAALNARVRLADLQLNVRSRATESVHEEQINPAHRPELVHSTSAP
jgi:D-alanyl-D-alanine carboxypeptidase/D-alanyl-D-alanine-endopeptidase (penicillin-binding protein 4)